MDSYYSNQASLPHFSGYYRQRGSGFGALARGIGRFALPLAKKYLLPAAKTIGKELIAQGTPEIMEVFKKRKTPRKAIKATVRKTLRKQLGKGRRRRRRSKPSKIISKRKRLQRSRAQFFAKVKK